MAITTRTAHVRRAQEFFVKENIYFAIGKSSSWTNEHSPDPEDELEKTLTEVIGYRKIDHKYYVVPDPSGTIVYKNGKYKIVSSEQVEAEGAKWVYLDTTIMYDELPEGTYRQIGLYQGLEKNLGVGADKVALLPSDVKKPGDLIVYDNRKMANRQADQKETLSLIIEF